MRSLFIGQLIYLSTVTMMRKFSTLPKYLFASEAVKSVEGHKPPAIADSAPGRYAGSLFTAASQNEALDVVLKDMTHLGKVLNQEQQIREFFKNTAIKRAQQREVINSFAPKTYHQITNNFLETLIETGRLGDTEKIIETFISYCKILNKQQDIRIISAKDLSEDEKSQVVAAIKQNKPDVKFKITYEVDPSIMGGLQVFAGTDFLDCSLRSRMNKLKLELAKI